MRAVFAKILGAGKARLRRVLVLAVLALIAAGVGWWYWSREMVLVERVALRFAEGVETRHLLHTDVKTLPGGRLLLHSEPQDDPLRRHWWTCIDRKGRRFWSVCEPQILLPSNRQNKRSAYSVSADGRHFVAMTIDTGCCRMARWREGKPVWDVTLHGDVPGQPLVLNSGQVLLPLETSTDTHLCLVEDGRVVSRALILPGAPPPASHGYRLTCRLSPDGQAMAVVTRSHLTWYRIDIAGTTVRLHKMFAVPEKHGVLEVWSSPYATFPLFVRNGLLAAVSGAVYSPRGVKHASDGWWLHPVYAPPSSTVITQTRSPARGQELARILHAESGKSWRVPGAGSIPVAVTADGRFILIGRNHWERESSIMRLVNRIPWLRRRIQEARARKWAPLELYERPGRLRARMPYDLNHWFEITPDGRTVHTIIRIDNNLPNRNNRSYRYELRTYAWRRWPWERPGGR